MVHPRKVLIPNCIQKDKNSPPSSPSLHQGHQEKPLFRLVFLVFFLVQPRSGLGGESYLVERETV
jgi:hypothetical protein